MSEDPFKKLVRQNEVIISLLGRMVFKPEQIREIVEKKKRNPQNYVNGYNACNGENSLHDIAVVVGVKDGTLSPILSDWEQIGIIFETERTGGKFYRKLFSI